MLKIIFNQDTSAYFNESAEYNLMYLKGQESYINELLRIRGYVYLNSIYEVLGVRWDPKWDNACIIYNEKYIDFGIRKNPGGFELNIIL